MADRSGWHPTESPLNRPGARKEGKKERRKEGKKERIDRWYPSGRWTIKGSEFTHGFVDPRGEDEFPGHTL